MKKALAFLFALMTVSLAGLAQTPPPPQPDVSGTWELTMQTPQGEMKNDATFTQTKVEDKYVIKFSMPGPMDMVLAGEGTITGNDLAWNVVINTPNGDFMLVFKGKLDGDKMTGEVQMGDFGTSTWTAVKKKS